MNLRAHSPTDPGPFLFRNAMLLDPRSLLAARAAVREELRRGADAIKIMVSGGVASPL